MAGAALNKSSLNRLRGELRTYERFLPTLQLKQQQLLAETARAREAVNEARAVRAEIEERAARTFPMLGHGGTRLAGLVTVDDVKLGERNVVGTAVPVLESANVRIADYSALARPHWVDTLAEDLVALAEAELRLQVAVEAHRRLAAAASRITQRVNLFEKVLIPGHRSEIARVRVFLADAERMAVVRSKIAKRKLVGG